MEPRSVDVDALHALLGASLPTREDLTMRTRARAVVIAMAVGFAVGPAVAQSSSTTASDVRSVTIGGPRASDVRAGTTQARAPEFPEVTSRLNETVEPVYQQRGRRHQGGTLMIVGFVALLLGAVIGDDAGKIVMLGGAGVGLYGLYLFLQ